MRGILSVEMPRKKPEKTDFGQRLLTLRKAKGLTQVQLAEAVGASQRSISYYESEGGYPPVPVIIELAKALSVTTDEMLGFDRSQLSGELVPPETRRYWKKFQQVQALPEKDQRAIIRLINSLSGSQKQATG